MRTIRPDKCGPVAAVEYSCVFSEHLDGQIDSATVGHALEGNFSLARSLQKSIGLHSNLRGPVVADETCAELVCYSPSTFIMPPTSNYCLKLC